MNCLNFFVVSSSSGSSPFSREKEEPTKTFVKNFSMRVIFPFIFIA